MAEMLAMHGAIASDRQGWRKCWQCMEQLPADQRHDLQLSIWETCEGCPVNYFAGRAGAQ
jgi:hypothetical protein